MSIAAEQQSAVYDGTNGKFDRSSSSCTEDSGVCTEEDTSSVSEINLDECEEDYHYVEALKVMGVHKQETPKVHYVS